MHRGGGVLPADAGVGRVPRGRSLTCGCGAVWEGACPISPHLNSDRVFPGCPLPAMCVCVCVCECVCVCVCVCVCESVCE